MRIERARVGHELARFGMGTILLVGYKVLMGISIERFFGSPKLMKDYGLGQFVLANSTVHTDSVSLQVPADECPLLEPGGPCR